MTPSSSTLSLLWNREIHRYKQKGLKNCALAFALMFIIIHGGTTLGGYLWPSDISNPAMFTIIAMMVIHLTCQSVYFLIFLPGYMGNKSYMKYETTPQAVRPWQRENWGTMKWRTVLFLFLTRVVIFPVVMFLSTSTGSTKLRFHDFPSSWEVFGQFIVVIFVEDFFFYWIHKLSHEIPFLYKYHKVHHQYEQLFTFVSEHIHPVDYVIGFIIPSAIPFILLGSNAHCFMLLFWQVWKIFISSEGHSGFEFPFSPTRILPLSSKASYHDFHHTMNAGNFAGTVYLWDTIFGTSDVYWNKIERERVEKGIEKEKLN